MLEAVYNGVLAKGASPFVYLRYPSTNGYLICTYNPTDPSQFAD